MAVHSSNRLFRFGDQTIKLIGMIECSLQTSRHIEAIPVLLDILPVIIQAFLGVDILDDYGLLADKVKNRL